MTDIKSAFFPVHPLSFGVFTELSEVFSVDSTAPHVRIFPQELLFLGRKSGISRFRDTSLRDAIEIDFEQELSHENLQVKV